MAWQLFSDSIVFPALFDAVRQVWSKIEMSLSLQKVEILINDSVSQAIVCAKKLTTDQSSWKIL